MVSVADIVNNMNLGKAKETIQGSTDSPLHTLLIGLQQEVIERLRASIDKYDVKASNRLKQSMVTVDNSKEGLIDVAISMEFYWKYVNYGVNGTKINRGAPTWGKAPKGTMSFRDTIKGWIRDKGIQARPGQTYDQLAYVISRSIKEKGIQARPFFTDVINKELTDFLTANISEVFGKAITIQIKDPWQ